MTLNRVENGTVRMSNEEIFKINFQNNITINSERRSQRIL